MPQARSGTCHSRAWQRRERRGQGAGNSNYNNCSSQSRKQNSADLSSPQAMAISDGSSGASAQALLSTCTTASGGQRAAAVRGGARKLPSQAVPPVHIQLACSAVCPALPPGAPAVPAPHAQFHRAHVAELPHLDASRLQRALDAPPRLLRPCQSSPSQPVSGRAGSRRACSLGRSHNIAGCTAKQGVQPLGGECGWQAHLGGGPVAGLGGEDGAAVAQARP